MNLFQKNIHIYTYEMMCEGSETYTTFCLIFLEKKEKSFIRDSVRVLHSIIHYYKVLASG